MAKEAEDAVAEIFIRHKLREIYETVETAPERARAAWKGLNDELANNEHARDYVIRRLLSLAGIMIEEDWDFGEPKTD